jgi:tetratricopeptide (TPR) repeat protein
LRIRRRLAEADPNDAQKQLDLAFSHVKMGFVYREQKEYQRAINSFESGLKLIRLLDEERRLAPIHQDKIEVLQQQIAECRKLQEESGN